MSKSSTASAQKPPLPTTSAWFKGPPNPSTSTPSRSQSPAPSVQPHQTHTRRSSNLGQGVPIKDGVSVPRSNVGALKQGSGVTFGSIDNDSVLISSSPATAPPIKSEGVKSFGTVPATVERMNGKPPVSSKPSSTTSAPSSSSAPPSATSAKKFDVSKLFQTPSSAPSSTPSDTSSPSLRPSALPSQSSSQHPPGQPPPSQPSQLGSHQYTPFAPNTRSQQNAGPSGGTPRSPVYQRQTIPNGTGPRPQNGSSNGPSPGLSSPRMGPHPHPGPPSGMPPPNMQPQIQPAMAVHAWPGYYYPQPSMSDQHFVPYSPWYSIPHQMPQQPQHQHSHHPPPSAGQHGAPYNGMPMSPRSQPPTLPPGTPTQAHAVPSGVHPPHPPPPQHSHSSSSSISITSPPPTPSTASSARLNANSSAFVPGSRTSKVILKTSDGIEVDLNAITKTPTTTSASGSSSPGPKSFRQGSPSAPAPAASTPPRRSANVRMETEEQHQKRLAEDAEKEKAKKAKAEAEEKEKREKERKEKEELQRREREIKEKEEAERKRKEDEEREAERLRKEEEEREAERLRKEEEERAARLRKEEEEREAERRRKEDEEKEAERLRKEEEEREAERLRKEEEERKAEQLRKEEEEKEQLRREEERRLEETEAENERMRRENQEKEAERLRQEGERAKSKATAEADAAQPSKHTGSTIDAMIEREEGEILETEEPVEETALTDTTKEKPRENLRINTLASQSVDFPKKRPGPLDLSTTKTGNIAQPLPSALATARHIENLDAVSYPQGISSPSVDLNRNVKDGKFRYDRAFLLQFMEICKEKPDNLPPLDAIGLEPNAEPPNFPISRGGSGRHRQMSSTSGPSRQASVGLGLSGVNKQGSGHFGSMGQFSSASKLSSDERFANSNRSVSVGGVPNTFSRPAQMQRTASQGGVGGTPMSSHRTRSQRGKQRGEKGGEGNKIGNQQHGFSHGLSNMGMAVPLEAVAPLQISANRWERKAMNHVDSESPEVVDRKVKALLNKLTMEKFDSISDQIIAWANKSEKEKDGRTLIQVIRLVFEKATDEATWSEMYARLCRKMMERISPQVQDDGIKNSEGKPITGGHLFRKYLLNRCQEDFERGWVAKEATAAAAATKSMEDQAAKDKAEGTGEVVLYSDEYYAAQKAKRQGLGLIKFIGELFKLQMLTERIMHECVKKLLGNVENPEEEEIESLCKLLSTVGSILDTQKARAHMDVYFSRMKELTKSPNVSPRMQYMLQDVIELRERRWVSRNLVAAPTTLAQVHEAAAKEKAAAEKEAYQRQISMSRGGSRRGADRSEYPQVGPDGWAVAGGNGPTRPPPKAGDLSNFGKITKTTEMKFGPSSVFNSKKDSKRESLSRTSSSSNMFSMLSGAESAAEPKAPEPQRKRLVLAPRTKPTTEDQEASAPKSESEGEEEEVSADMTEEQANNKIAEDLKELFAVRNLDEAEVYFTNLLPVHHSRLVEKFTSRAIESKEADAELVAQLFTRAVTKEICSPDAFEEGFTPLSEAIDDIAIDAPKALSFFAIIVKSARLEEERRRRLAAKSLDNEQLLTLIS